MAIADWLNIRPSMGSGDYSVSVQAEANDGNERSFALTMRTTNIDLNFSRQ